MRLDYNKAISAGYSDQEINDFVSKRGVTLYNAPKKEGLGTILKSAANATGVPKFLNNALAAAETVGSMATGKISPETSYKLAQDALRRREETGTTGSISTPWGGEGSGSVAKTAWNVAAPAVQTGLTATGLAGGVTRGMLGSAAVGGLAGGTVSKLAGGTFSEGLGSGVGSAPMLVGVGKVVGNIYSKTGAKRVVDNAASKIVDKFRSARAQDIETTFRKNLNITLGKNNQYSAKDETRAVEWVRKNLGTKLSPQEYRDAIQHQLQNNRDAARTLMGKAKNTVEMVYDKFGNVKDKGLQKFADTLVDRVPNTPTGNAFKKEIAGKINSMLETMADGSKKLTGKSQYELLDYIGEMSKDRTLTTAERSLWTNAYKNFKTLLPKEVGKIRAVDSVLQKLIPGLNLTVEKGTKKAVTNLDKATNILKNAGILTGSLGGIYAGGKAIFSGK